MSELPTTIREQVTSRIRDELLVGSYPAGHSLRETELAKKFGVSRGPIRDALLQLSQEGFLAYQANRGVTVRQAPAPEERELITSLRQQLEVFVLERGLHGLTGEPLGRVEAALKRLRDACAAGEVVDIARCDMAFHEAILVGCGGENLTPVWRLLCTQMLLTYTRHDNYDAVFQEHAEIFAAIMTQKKAIAVNALKANIT